MRRGPITWNGIDLRMSRRVRPVFIFIMALLLGIVATAILWSWGQLPFVVIWFISVSLMNFTLYGADKFQARHQGWRVPEIVLHSLAAAGGFVGGWLGMAIFNHKHRKGIFWVILTMTTVFYGLLILAVLSGQII